MSSSARYLLIQIKQFIMLKSREIIKDESDHLPIESPRDRAKTTLETIPKKFSHEFIEHIFMEIRIF
jgi:hypothetical protein